MKKLLCVLLTLLLLSGVILGLLGNRGLTFSVGHCIVMDDTCMLVLDNTPVQLHNRTGNESAFAALATGDQLLILHDDIATTYPAQASVYFCQRIGTGAGKEIPQSVMDQLTELGWVIKVE